MPGERGHSVPTLIHSLSSSVSNSVVNRRQHHHLCELFVVDVSIEPDVRLFEELVHWRREGKAEKFNSVELLC